VARRYVYQVSTRRTAFAKPYVWWVRETLDLERMRRAAAAFVGMHDFSAFAVSERDDEKSTRVLLERLDIVEDGALILIGIEGSHFLWRMVRRLVGVLVAVGRGDLSEREATALLHGTSERPAALTAPASGLFLERVCYTGDERDAPLRAVTGVK